MAEYLGIVKLGTFYHNGEALSLPTRPWYSGGYPEKLSDRGNGDTPKFSNNMSDWVIGDTNSNEDKKLRWVKIKDGNKTLLICDRNILDYTSWDKLNNAGYVDGTKITIDGNEYLCRLLSGGSDYGKFGSGAYFGGNPEDNEWDRFICNENNIEGLPTPQDYDLVKVDDTYKSLDGQHNKLWNWWGIASWCKETYKRNSQNRRVNRGYNSPRYFSSDYGSTNSFGWRPVLEVLNYDPEVSNSKDTNPKDSNNEDTPQESNNSEHNTSKDPSTRKFLIKQNDNYYTIDNGYIDLGQVNTKSDLNNLFDKYGFENLSLITKEFDGKKVHMTKDTDDIWETDSEIDVNKVEGDVQLVEENNEKYIKYGFGKCNIPDEINKINDGKFKILMK
ncbi:TPA: hypothetical protein PTV31_003093 [Clostridium botulinum]|nr:hypothetical protein [Clostridium botulinum]